MGSRFAPARVSAAPAARAGLLSTAFLLAVGPVHAEGGVASSPDAFALRLDPPVLLDEPRPTHHGRALLEALAVQVGGTIWYWEDLDFNTRDWDLRWDSA